MLRAVSAISFESPVLDVLVSASARREFCKLIRIQKYSQSAGTSQIVLTAEGRRADDAVAGVPPAAERGAPPPPPPPPRRSWALAAAAAAVTASLGGAYLYSTAGEGSPAPAPASAPPERPSSAAATSPAPDDVYPALGEALPRHVHYLLVGGGTASFAAMRALRAARPDAAVLVVGEEPLPPYMRPPLSKEVWREPPPADEDLPALTFRQWNGKRRPLLYEPPSFYTPVEALAERGGAAAARGWRVVRLHVERHEAELRAPGREPVLVGYDKCLVATGVVPRRLAVLAEARAAGRVVTVRGARDAARLARMVEAPGVRRVLVVGGGFLATELAAALADRLSETGVSVTLVCRERAPLVDVLPPYLAEETARRLRAAGVELRLEEEVAGVGAGGAQVRLRGAGGEERALAADVVVECVGSELDGALAAASGLEVAGGGLQVNAELQARADVWAAGDAASWHDVALGRRRLEHHDHAVASGRRAGENMAAPPGGQRAYTHQPMFWSDLGPDLGYEAIGIIDSRLPTVGVFSEADVRAEGAAEAGAGGVGAVGGGARRYDRGVVFYTRDSRVVGVLLWNLFNRMHVARQVLAQGEFEDLFEVAKLFSLHEED